MSNIDKLYEKSRKLQGLLKYYLSKEIVEGDHIENYKWVKAEDVTNEDIKSMDKQIILFKIFFLKKNGVFFKKNGVFFNEEEIQFSNNKVMINNQSMTFVNFEDFLDGNLKKIDNNKKNLRSKFLNLSSVPINDNTVRISDERLKSNKNARSQFVRNGNQKITIYYEPTISNSPRISHERLNVQDNEFNNRDNTVDTGQREHIEQTGQAEQTEQTVETEQTGQREQREQREQIEQTEIDRQKRQKLIKRERILRHKINMVISPNIFKRTINTILDYLKSPLTPNHFNNSINDSKFSNLLSFLQFEEENAEKYKNLFKEGPGLVRTESNKQDTPLQILNIFQIVTLVILFRNYLNHKKDQATLKNYLNSIKNGNNKSDKIIRLLYLVLIFEFNQRISIENMNKKTTYRNQILTHYSPNNLGNESRKLQREMEKIGNESIKLQREMEKIGNALGKP
jgi:hypothetical protein